MAWRTAILALFTTRGKVLHHLARPITTDRVTRQHPDGAQSYTTSMKAEYAGFGNGQLRGLLLGRSSRRQLLVTGIADDTGWKKKKKTKRAEGGTRYSRAQATACYTAVQPRFLSFLLARENKSRRKKSREGPDERPAEHGLLYDKDAGLSKGGKREAIAEILNAPREKKRDAELRKQGRETEQG